MGSNGTGSVLLVEGANDKYTLLSLLQKHDIPEVFSVIPKDGISHLLDSFEVTLEVADRLGLIVDADNDLSQRWEEIRKILASAGFSGIPSAPDPEGTVLGQPGKPTVGVWIMPDNRVPGSLEHFIELLVPQGDRLWDWAQETVDSVPASAQRFALKDRQKALVHLWLAVQKDPGTPIGWAITKRYLDPDAQSAVAFMNWIRRVLL